MPSSNIGDSGIT